MSVIAENLQFLYQLVYFDTQVRRNANDAVDLPSHDITDLVAKNAEVRQKDWLVPWKRVVTILMKIKCADKNSS